MTICRYSHLGAGRCEEVRARVNGTGTTDGVNGSAEAVVMDAKKGKRGVMMKKEEEEKEEGFSYADVARLMSGARIAGGV